MKRSTYSGRRGTGRMIVEGKEELEEDDHAEWKAQLDEGERVARFSPSTFLRNQTGRWPKKTEDIEKVLAKAWRLREYTRKS
jgi:hypothetical protein